MSERARVLACGVAAAAITAGMLLPAAAADVTQSRLENPAAEPQNWLMQAQNYSSHRYSLLDQINRDNVGGLKAAFALGLPSTGVDGIDIEAAPLVDDGFMYLSDGWGGIHKVDVREGKARIVWSADPAIDRTDRNPRTRGIAFLGNMVVANLLDGRVVGVDRDTGEFVLDQQVAGANEFDVAEQFTAAPIVVEDRIIVGQSRGDAGTRGWLAAVDAANGQELWRFYTVPGPGEPGHETWQDDHNAWKTGGAALWTTGSYDPGQRVTIWGTGNPVPMFDPEFRPGDNLYSNSAIAVDVDTGEMRWYFQYTPNESWDYDEQGVHMLYDVEVNGEMRKVVGHFARNGFFYSLDRTNGEFIFGNQFTEELTWTAGLDPKTGKPLEYDPTLALQTYIPAARAMRGGDAIQVCPTHRGGLRWQPPAYNPDKAIAYGAGAEGCTELTVDPRPVFGDQPLEVGQRMSSGGKRTVPKYYGAITAMDARTGEIKAKHNLNYENKSGVLATAGGLVFTGNQDGRVAAYNDETLDELWGFETGTPFKAPAMTYSVDGKQYVAIIAGGSPDADQPPEMKTMFNVPIMYVFAL